MPISCLRDCRCILMRLLFPPLFEDDGLAKEKLWLLIFASCCCSTRLDCVAMQFRLEVLFLLMTLGVKFEFDGESAGWIKIALFWLVFFALKCFRLEWEFETMSKVMPVFELCADETREALADDDIFLGLSIPFCTIKSLEAPTLALGFFRVNACSSFLARGGLAGFCFLPC